jgi:DNA invertase Pin-like site-specific DNA recombinase
MTMTKEAKAISKSEANTRHRVAIGYVRVAAELQSGSCLDAQATQIREIADAEGIELIGVVGDSGKSAHNLNRPGLLTLLGAVAAGAINTVIVPDLSRLARNPQDLRRLLRLFDSRGVTLVSAANAIDSSTAGRTLCQLASIFG